jgi:phage shock protein C
MINQQRRLYRSRSNRVIAGICGGLGEYLNADPTIIRLIWILLTLLGGSGLIIYIIAYFIIPVRTSDVGDTVQSVRSDSAIIRIVGILFVSIGAIILLDNLDILSFHRWWDLTWDFFFPGILILAGLYFLTKREGILKSQSTQMPQTEAKQPTQEQAPPPVSPSETSPKSKMLNRSQNDKKIFGICGGLGEYFNIDPTIVRIAYVVFTAFTGGFGIILYFLLYLIIPETQQQLGKQ